MPELKLDFKNLGAIRLMPLDTASLFLPFGRPIADYVRGLAGNQNGTRALLKQGSIEFLPRIQWTESTSRKLRTTGFGELEREGVVESAAVSTEPRDPGVADFLAFEFPKASAKEAVQAKLSPAMGPQDLPVSRPRINALPLRPRMTFGPPPAAKVKTAPTPAPKPVPAPPAAKAAPAVVAPPKPSPVPAVKPVAPAAPVKVSAPAATQPKPVTVIPPAPKPTLAPAPAPRVALPQTPSPVVSAPAARALETAPTSTLKPVAAPASPKTNTPVAPSVRAPEQAAPTPKLVPEQSKPAPAPIAAAGPRIQAGAVTPAKPASTIIISPKAPAPPVSSSRALFPPSPVESAPASEVISRETPRERETGAPKPAASVDKPSGSTFEPHLSMGDEAESASFLTRIPMAVKIGVAILLLAVAGYFVFGKSESASSSGVNRAVAVGEQGWSTEWASDAAGSRRGRQLTIYRPSVGMTDYQLQFVGQIESKALGWVFRQADTKNYYGMKIENIRPGAMAISHFAVVDGRQSSDTQKPVGIDARPGAAYHVKLEVNGPRFTTYIAGEPVDFWTDNRLKTGAVGFMNERDERGATSSVQFSFAQGAK
jgi:hypothetical protein